MTLTVPPLSLYPFPPILPCPLSSFSLRASGCTCIILAGGREVFTWGSGDFGVLGHGDQEDQLLPKLVEAVHNPEVLDSPASDWTMTQIACGGWHMALLLEKKESKTEASVGAKVSRRASATSGPVEEKTKLLTWGAGMCGQLGHGQLLDESVPKVNQGLSGKEVVQVACGASHTAVVLNIDGMGRKLVGQLWTWGNGVPSTGT